MSPLGRLHVGTRAALRRRYGYAALRVLRRALHAAINQHRARQVEQRPYSIATQELVEAYARALQRLRKRWPHLPFNDPRSNP